MYLNQPYNMFIGIDEEKCYISDNLEFILDSTNKLIAVEKNDLVTISEKGIEAFDATGKRKQNIIMELKVNKG